MARTRTAVNRTVLGAVGLSLFLAGSWLTATDPAFADRLPTWWPAAGTGTVLLDRNRLAQLRGEGWWTPTAIAASIGLAVLFALVPRAVAFGPGPATRPALPRLHSAPSGPGRGTGHTRDGPPRYHPQPRPGTPPPRTAAGGASARLAGTGHTPGRRPAHPPYSDGRGRQGSNAVHGPHTGPPEYRPTPNTPCPLSRTPTCPAGSARHVGPVGLTGHGCRRPGGPHCGAHRHPCGTTTSRTTRPR